MTQLPGINETLRDFAPNPANQPSILLHRPSPVANKFSAAFQSESRPPNGGSQDNDPNKGDAAQILNIYKRRADQIGPGHRIRGIGHLGDLLPPPGWRMGDDPITEDEAKQLFADSRAQAKKMLEQSISESSQLSIEDQEKLSVDRNTKYQTQRLLDELLLLERMKLYNFFRERKEKQSQQMHSQTEQYRQLEPRLTFRPQPLQPMQPPAETSMIGYQRHQQLLVPASPHLYAPSPPMSGGTLNARINFMQQGIIRTLLE